MRHSYYSILLTLILFSCSTTRNLPEDETLYTGIERIEYVNDSALKHTEAAWDEVNAALAYPPNNAIFGSSSHRWPLPFGLWTYNAFANRQKGIGKWIFNTFANEPVYLSSVNPDVRSKVATNLLHDYGFFRGQVTNEIIPLIILYLFLFFYERFNLSSIFFISSNSPISKKDSSLIG